MYKKTRPKAPEKNLEGKPIYSLHKKILDFSRLRNEVRMGSLVPRENHKKVKTYDNMN